MLRPLALIPYAFRICTMIAIVVKLTTASPPVSNNGNGYNAPKPSAADVLSYQWNLSDPAKIFSPTSPTQ